MSDLTEKQQHQITAEHLRNGMEIEVWLIPFCATVSLVVIFIVIIVIMHIVKQKNCNSDSTKKQIYSQAQRTDILLEEGIILQIKTSRVKTSPMVYFSKVVYSDTDHVKDVEERETRKNNAEHQKYSQANTADSDEMLTFQTEGPREESSFPNGNFNSNNTHDDETNASSRSYLWPPKPEETNSNQSPWTPQPSSNL